MFKDQVISEFIEDLASKSPAPGGGGAAALAGTIAMALGSMVASLTIGKKTYADVEEEIIELNEKATSLQQELLALMDEDEKCFRPLAKAYGMPTNTEEEKQLKAETIEQCSKAACQPPYQIMVKCCEAIDIIAEFAEKGSKLAVSDAGCAAVIAKSALQAAALNVFINTKSIKDRDFADVLNQMVNNMLDRYGKNADEIYHDVKNKLV